MLIGPKQVPLWYKWLVLATACLSTFFTFGYITGTTSIVSVYYTNYYNETVVSKLIGPAQIGFMQIGSLPSLFLLRWTGNMVLQIVGGLLLPVGIILTSFTTQSWQGLLLSGMLSGVAGAMILISTTQLIKTYFPGRQIAPFGAMCLTTNIAAMVFPQVWEQLMDLQGWFYGVISIGSLLFVNVVCGLTYVVPSGGSGSTTTTSTKEKSRRSKIILLLKPKSVPTHPIEVTDGTSTVDSALEGSDSLLENSAVHTMMIEENERDSCGKLTQTGEDNICNTLVEEKMEPAYNRRSDEQGSLKETINQLQVLALLMMSCLYSGGLTSIHTIMSVYVSEKLGMTANEVAFSLTVMGCAQLVASLFYIFLTCCTEFCATLLHSTCLYLIAISGCLLPFTTMPIHFTILVALNGFAKAIVTGNSVPLAIEMVRPELVMNLYVLKCLVDGFGSGGIPFFAAYMTEAVGNEKVLFISSAMVFTSATILLPFSRRYLWLPAPSPADEEADQESL